MSTELAAAQFLRPLEHDAELIPIFSEAFEEALPVDLPQRSDEGVAVLFADLTIEITMSIIKSWLFHLDLPSGFIVAASGSSYRSSPPPQGRWLALVNPSRGE